MSRRLTDRIAAMIEETLNEIGLDDLHYEITLDIMPGPQGPQPVMILAMAMPSSIMGEWVSGVAVIPNLVPDMDQVRGGVLQMLNSLRAEKAKTTETVMASASSNGHKETPPHASGGLILPG